MSCYDCVEKDKCPLRDPNVPDLIRNHFKCDKKDEPPVSSGPAQVYYMPVCSECGEFLQSNVKLTISRSQICQDLSIEPEVCPNCGAKFTGVTVWQPVIERE